MTPTTKMMIASEEKGKRNNRVVVSICIRIYSLQSCCFSFAREKERKKRSSSSSMKRHVESNRIDFAIFDDDDDDDASLYTHDKTHPSVIIVLAIVDLIRVSGFELLLILIPIPMMMMMVLVMLEF